MAATSSKAPAPSSPPTSTSPAVGRGLHQFVWLVGNQLVSRLLTFLLNLLIARKVGPELFGFATIHLHLPYLCVLTLVRESLRRTVLRYSCSDELVRSVTAKKDSADVQAVQRRLEVQQVVNLSWVYTLLSLPLCVLITAITTYTTHAESLPKSVQSQHTLLCTVYTSCAFIELWSEPLYNVASKQLYIRLRVFIESVSLLLRVIVTYVLVVHLGYGIEAFVIAQLCYSSSITLMYYLYYVSQLYQSTSPSHNAAFTSVRQLFPSLAATYSKHKFLFIDPTLLKLSMTFSVQSVEKLVLTEGEKLILVLCNASSTAQGVYSLVSNIGSLIARFIFQPLEESSYTEFATQMAHTLTLEPDSSEYKQQYRTSAHLLSVLLKLVIILSTILLAIGPNYTQLFFHLLYGSQWSSTAAPTALSCYFIYILVISLNGLTEAYVFATINTKQLQTYNYLLLLFSGVYMLVCVVLVPYGVVGLILANCMNMGVRILYSLYYIYSTVSQNVSQQYAVQTLKSALPSLQFTVALIIASVITSLTCTPISSLSSASFVAILRQQLLHIATGGICTVALGYLVYMLPSERAAIREFTALFQRKKGQAA